MKTFTVSQTAQNKWMNLGNLGADGANVMVRFEPGVGMVVKRVIPERVVQAAMENAKEAREIFKKGKVLRSHARWLPVYSMPVDIREQWTQELGDPKKDPDAWKRWKQRLNSSEYRHFRTSEHHL